MTALNKQALREAAERAASDGWGYDRDEFNDAITPEVVLALLDELEAAEKRIAELESRTVTVKLPEEFSDDEALLQEIEFCDDVSMDIQTAQWLKELRRRRAAGIQVIEGEGQ